MILVDYKKPEDIAAIVGLATIAARVIWGALSLLWHFGSERVYARVRSCSLDLGPFDHIPKAAKLKCLVVRYGTDKYLEHLAPAQDKFEGRLRNKVHDVELTGREGTTFSFKASIPVHGRLGTQFKFFFEVESKADADSLSRHNAFVEPYAALLDKPIKVWFLVRDFGTTTTIEGFQNNFWPAF